MKRVVAAVITGVLLAIAVFCSRSQPLNNERPEDIPNRPPAKDCIERMFDAAEKGDLETYIDCFTGPERKRLDRDLETAPKDRFAQSLKDALQPLMGRAISDPLPEDDDADNSDTTSLVVERIYANRNETQTYFLRYQNNRWRIFEVRKSVVIQPPIPFGTPVYESP